MSGARFHIVYTFKYIKYGLALSVIPMLRLLFRLDFESFLMALQQDVFILLGMALLSLLMWRATGCSWDGQTLRVQKGVVTKQVAAYIREEISVVEVRRPLYCRILGAAVVSVYFRAGCSPKKCQIYLSKKNALLLLDGLCPLEGEVRAGYHARGMHRVLLVLLSSNLLSTILLGFFGYRQLVTLFGSEAGGISAWLYQGAITLEQTFEILLPQSAAVVTTLLFLLALFTFTRSFVNTFRHRVHRQGRYIVEQCGLLGRTERRIRTSRVTQCDIRLTPLARLFRLRPVFIRAGGYTGEDVPLLLVASVQDPLLHALLPRYKPPRVARVSNMACKSLPLFIWAPGALFAFFLLVYLTAMQVLAGILPLLAIPLLLCLGGFAAHLEAYFREGVAAVPGGGIYAVYTRFFTRHHVCLLTRNLTLQAYETPLSAQRGRAYLRIHTPSARLRIRGVGRYTAREIRL